MSFIVRFWGVRGSIPTPGPSTSKFGGNTSCVEVEVDGARFICDAGSGIRELGLELMASHDGPVVGHLLFSHMHWDHIQGFPFFGPAYVPQNHFTIWGPRPDDRRFAHLLSGQMHSDYFPVEFQDLGGCIEDDTLGEDGSTIDGVLVRSYLQNHPGSSFAYRLEKRGFAVVYATDSELDQVMTNSAESEADPAALRRFPEDMVGFVEGADLLVADGQYSDEEYERYRGWGHPRATSVVDLAVQAGVKRVAIFHHDPMHDDRQVSALMEVCRQRAKAHGSEVDVFAAREGIELRIDRFPA